MADREVGHLNSQPSDEATDVPLSQVAEAVLSQSAEATRFQPACSRGTSLWRDEGTSTQASAGGGADETEYRIGGQDASATWQGLGVAAQGLGRYRGPRKRRRAPEAVEEVSDAESDVIDLDGGISPSSRIDCEVEIVVDAEEPAECAEVSSPSCSPPVSPPRDADIGGASDAAVEEDRWAESARMRIRRPQHIEDFIALDDSDDEGSADDARVMEPVADPCVEQPVNFGGDDEDNDGSDVVEVKLTPMPERNDVEESDVEKSDDSRYSGLCTKYHVRAFDYVLDHVLQRYQHVLRRSDVVLARCFTALPPVARALFVRIHRRIPAWHSTEAIISRYASDFEDSACIKGGALGELVDCGALVSAQAFTDSSRQQVAVEVLHNLSADELRRLCGIVSGGKALRARSRDVILAGLMRVMVDGADGVEVGHLGTEKKGKSKEKGGCAFARPKRLRQATIDGSSPKENLIRGVLKVDRVAVPKTVLAGLRRINFLFFFEGGSDRPWVMLANVGKVKFPRYECIRTLDVFCSAAAYEDYEAARALEMSVENAVTYKDWPRALELGAIGELEVLEFSRARAGAPSIRNRDPSASSSLWVCGGQASSRFRRRAHANEVERQLAHPFYRRYTAIVRYCRATWKSVKALEVSREYETAVRRLRMLLSISLLPAHVGKMTDRLTVNLVHLGDDAGALSTIVSVLSSSTSHLLHRGDVASLARRGARVHRRMRLPIELSLVPTSVTVKSRRAKAADVACSASQPEVITTALHGLRTAIPVRMLRGKALPQIHHSQSSQQRPSSQQSFVEREDEDVGLGDSGNFVGVKSRFLGLASGSLDVCVEELGLEWYRAHAQWKGAHDEGRPLRFLWCLLMYDCVYAPVADVFQTEYQVAPWDLNTEVFYSSRKKTIDTCLDKIERMSLDQLYAEVRASYLNEARHGALCVASAWDNYSVDDMCCIAGGLGGKALRHICDLLCQDFGYWAGGMPDLTLWKWSSPEGESLSSQSVTSSKLPHVKLSEVKSQRDILSSKQRAWLAEFLDVGVDCEVFKVVEKETKRNAGQLIDSDLDAAQLGYLELDDVASADVE